MYYTFIIYDGIDNSLVESMGWAIKKSRFNLLHATIVGLHMDAADVV